MYTCKYCDAVYESEGEVIEYRNFDYFQTCLACDKQYDFVNHLHYHSKMAKLKDEIYALTHAEEILKTQEDDTIENRYAYYRSLSPINGINLEEMTNEEKEKTLDVLELRSKILKNKRTVYYQKLKETNSFVCDQCNHRYKGEPNKIEGQEYTRILCNQCKKEHDTYYEKMHSVNENELNEEELNHQSFLTKISMLEKEIEILEDYKKFNIIDPELELHYFGRLKLSSLRGGFINLELLRRKEELTKVTEDFYRIDSEKMVRKNTYQASQRKEKIINQASTEVSISNIAFDPIEFKTALDHLVIGQEDAKIQIIIECLKFFNGYSSRNNLLLIGPSGSGKTHLVNSFVQLLSDYHVAGDFYYKTAEEGNPDGIPYLEVDIQQFTAAGYKGREVSDMFKPLINQYQGDMEKMAGAIIFIDEIDKIAGFRLSDDQERNLKAVQQNLLKLIEGDKIPFTYEDSPGIVDTSKFLFIGAGAFEGLGEIREDRLSGGARTIGFDSNTESTIESTSNYTTEDLIEYGLIPELLGRLPIVSELNGLDTEEWVHFLKHNKKSPIHEAKQVCKQFGIAFTFKEEYYSLLAEKCNNHPLGVRGVRKEFMQLFNQQLYESIRQNGVLQFEYIE